MLSVSRLLKIGSRLRVPLLGKSNCSSSSEGFHAVTPSLEGSLSERRRFLESYRFERPPHYSTFYDFDAWVYGLQWPQMPAVLPMYNRLSVVADDIKFASNAWSLLRVCAFYGLPHPRVLSGLEKTTPSMSPNLRGNWKFYEHCEVNSRLNPKAAKVALMPSHPKAVQLADCDWSHLARNVSRDGTVEIVLGMENGMREDVCEQCDAWLSIPQYGSCGSLSMLNALGIVVHSAASVLHPRAAQRRLFIGSSEAKAGKGAVSEKPDANGTEDMTESATTRCNNSDSTAAKHLHPTKIVHEGLHHSSAVGRVAEDDEIEFLATAKREFDKSRPHGDELLGLDDTQIAHLLRERRKHLPLQLATFHYNESGDRNIGAIIRNGNIYNIEKMVIVGRKKFSRRGSVGTHNYTDIRFYENFETADEAGAFSDYALWVLHNPFAHLCNRVDEIVPGFVLPKQLSVGKKEAKSMPCAYMPSGHSLVQQWLRADANARLESHAPEQDDAAGWVLGEAAKTPLLSCGGDSDSAWRDTRYSGGSLEHDALRTEAIKIITTSATLGGDVSAASQPSALSDWERKHPMYGVIADRLKPTVHLDDELSIIEAVADVKRRGLRGVMLAVPEEGSTPVWPELVRCERLATVFHPARVCGSVQRGLTSAVSTAIALERLREATLMFKK